MGKCVNHPDRETGFRCQKHGYYVCEECLVCRDPLLYCKFRTSCPVRFMEKGADSLEDTVGNDEMAETGR